MTSLVLAVVFAASPAGQEPALLGTAADARRVCEAAALPEALDGSDGILERAEARERHAEERESALAARYAAVFPGERLRFGAWDPGEQVLALQPHAPILTADGGL